MHHSSQLTPLTFLKKRFAPIALVFSITLAVSLGVISSLPSLYRSWATLLVEGNTAPAELLRASAAGFVQEHINSVMQMVLSREALMKIVKDFQLYPEMIGRASDDEIIERMHRNVIFETSVAAAEESNVFGRMPSTTYSVRIGFISSTPKTCTAVSIVLLNRFNEQSSSRRETKTPDTFVFLRTKLADTQQGIAQVEQEIAQFKQAHMKSLPELMNMNLLALERVQKEMDQAQAELNLARERRLYLEGQLAIQEPMRHVVTGEGQKVLSVEEQVRQMRNQLLALRAVQSDKHPDVISLSRRLEAMQGVLGTREKLRSATERLDERRNALADLRRKYSPHHPDVVALEKEVGILSATVAELSSRPGLTTTPEEDSPDNPAYISLMTQLEQTTLEIAAKEKLQASLVAKYEDYLKRIEQTPGVEQEFLDLQRRYETLQASHRDINARLQAAKEAMEAERRDLGVKLTVLESPVIPVRPFKPDRMILSMLGLILSVGAGLLAGFAAESFDPTVHGPQEASSVTGLPLLGVFPSVQTNEERVILFKRRRAALVLGLGALVLALGAWYLFTPICTLCSNIAKMIHGLF